VAQTHALRLRSDACKAEGAHHLAGDSAKRIADSGRDQ
jgi:hypothetical protein